jgi:hypothetical protein
VSEPTRVEKGGKRFYQRNAPKPPIVQLIPMAVEAFKSMFASNGVDPSVTTILGMLAKPALISWAAREERKMVSNHAARLYNKLYDTIEGRVEPATFISILNEELGKGAHLQLLAKAANVGTEVQARVEWEFKGELGLDRPIEPPLLTTEQAHNSYKRWTEWRASVQLKVVAIEKRVHSSLFGFGGTLDLLAWITIDNVTMLVVIDWKTGKRVYAEAFLQNMAYRMALMEEGIMPKGGWIIRLPKSEEDPEFDAVSVPDDPTLASTFLALRAAYGWWEKTKEAKR